MLRSIVLAGGIAAFAAHGAAASPLTDRYSSFWVFGDSLSDNGNLFRVTSAPPISDPTPASPPYSKGRFSNGPVWNEGILAGFGLNGGNFAFGGAKAETTLGGVPDLGEQVALFDMVPESLLGDRPLASLWFGANDLFAALDDFADGSKMYDDVLAAAAAAADAVGAGVRALDLLNITDFAVWNLPDLGFTPAYFTTPLKQVASDAANAFNARLHTVLAELRTDQFRVTEIDTASLFNEVLADAASGGTIYGFDDVATPCLVPGISFCGDQTEGLLYFDPVHPTAAAHAVLADTFLAAVPLPGSGVLLAFGIGLLALRRRAA